MASWGMYPLLINMSGSALLVLLFLALTYTAMYWHLWDRRHVYLLI